MPSPTTQGKSIKLHKLGHTSGRDYGNSTGSRKTHKPRDLSVKK